ncbi:globin domain-containing protein [Sulfurovum sp. XGS-02]|uniref:globin domain-containing protein n=1 Tax=Sulfurovum sp. XGS-02 TaxID=2925411 RepID=UPI0020586D3D|nr:globin domain-containing protein [Sulfurovum sp. XGS-02]UPT78586.1 globin domain-containing protein [Sulfurovum sp. XGS-02]
MALSKKTIEICKGTAPLLVEYGEAIATRMYENLFTNYPQTRALFSEAPEEQNKKLAGVIIAYSANIDKLHVLSSTVDSMAKRHVKINVKPEHYPMVGESLLQAIKDVLGPVASDDIIEAWKEAYFFLGNILISRENDLYTMA